jgi:PAS domain S-box-containing protein
MALIDRDFKFIAASKKWVSDYKLEDTEFWGKTYFEVFSFKDAARLNGWRAIFEDCLNGHSRENSEEKFIEKDGSVIWIKWKVNPWYSDTGQVGGLIILTEDITKFKESKEEELRQVLKLTQSQNDRLRNFAHIVSHNLRSHSGNIQSLIALILEEKPELREDELIMMMDQSSGNLMETITHLSEVAFMNIKEDEKMSVVDVFDTLEKAIDNVSVLALNANVKISNNLKGNEKILGIPAYLDSILLNFITNGIKYRSTERNSFITIHSEINNENLIISIEDNGLGIDMKRHGTKLFGMYKTFHKNTDSRGIGLFITKNQIEAMGGKIEVESQVGVGTTFKIYFKQITN